MFRIVSFKIGRRGTFSKKPAMIVYASKRKDNIFHQFFFKIFLFFVEGAKIRVMIVCVLVKLGILLRSCYRNPFQIRKIYSPKEKFTAALACIKVVSKSGKSKSLGFISKGISVHPKIIPSAPSC